MSFQVLSKDVQSFGLSVDRLCHRQKPVEEKQQQKLCHLKFSALTLEQPEVAAVRACKE